MPKFKIINSDQGHRYTHFVDAVDQKTAIRNFSAGHYGTVIDCEKVDAEGKSKLQLLEEQNALMLAALTRIRPMILDAVGVFGGGPKMNDVFQLLNDTIQRVQG